MSIFNTFQTIVNYYDRTRNVGHSYAQIHGINKLDSPPLFLVENLKHMSHVPKLSVIPVTPETLARQVQGVRKPLVVEHYALRQMLAKAIVEHEAKVTFLEEQLRIANDRIQELEAQLKKQKKEISYWYEKSRDLNKRLWALEEIAENSLIDPASVKGTKVLPILGTPVLTRCNHCGQLVLGKLTATNWHNGFISVEVKTYNTKNNVVSDKLYTFTSKVIDQKEDIQND